VEEFKKQNKNKKIFSRMMNFNFNLKID